MAAIKLGLESVPVIRLSHLSDIQRRAYILADNKLAELGGGWDEEMLKVELEAVKESDIDHLLTGFTEEELTELLTEDKELNGDPDEVPEAPEEPTTKPGDLWLLGDHRLLCGDSTKAEDVERLMAGSRINVAFTSPPYASQRDYDESSGFKPIHPDAFVDWWEPIQAAVKNHLDAKGSFFVNIKPACEGLERLLYVFDLVIAMKRKWGWLFAEEFCWERSGIPQQVVRRFKNQFEPVYQFVLSDWKFRPKDVMHESESVPLPLGKGAGDTKAAKRQGKTGAVDPNEIVSGMAYPGNRLPTFSSTHTALGHSAAFPVGLPSFFIRAYSDQGDNVYEPFCGSGSTLIAAEQLGRKCYGMEISPAYCDVIVKRWETLTGKKATLEPR
jgi:DNA modification methylase